MAVVVVLLAVGWLLYRAQLPRVTGFSPGDGAQDLPVGTVIEIDFSKPMQAETVEERLRLEPRMEGDFIWQDNSLRFVPAEDWEEGTQVRVTLAEGARTTQGWAMPLSTSWSFTIGRTLLVYLWPADGSADLYALDPVSGETRRWTTAGGVQDFSIDFGNELVYFSARDQQEGGDLWVVDRRSGDVRQVLDCGEDYCANVQVSPDGNRLAFEIMTPAGDASVWLMSLTANHVSMLSQTGHEAHGPQWAPDGLLAYYDAREQAYLLLDLETGDTDRLENQTGEPGSWSPTGLRFVVREIFPVTTEILRGPTGEVSNQPVDEEELEPVIVAASNLVSYNTNTGMLTNLSRSTELEDANPSFSPDGRWLAFARSSLDEQNWTPGRQLWLMRSDGSEAQALTADKDYNYSAFTWHLEEPWLVAVRSNTTLMTEPPELWLINVSSGEMIRLVIGGFSPLWIP